MDRRDFYFKQAVTELELNGAFDAVEQAIWNFIVDMGLYGIASGMQGAQVSLTPSLAVTVSGPGYAFDQAGERIFVPALQTVDVSQDSSLVPTHVISAGNEKWISVFIKFARALSDPRVDGNSVTIDFQSNESFAFVVVQGAEATIAIPPAVTARPTKDPTMLLLFDVHLIYGQSSVMNADIDTTRRDDTFVLAQTPIALRAGNMQSAIAAMLTALNEHVLGSLAEHADTVITSVARTGTYFGLAAGTVGSQLLALQAALNVAPTPTPARAFAQTFTGIGLTSSKQIITSVTITPKLTGKLTVHVSAVVGNSDTVKHGVYLYIGQTTNPLTVLFQQATVNIPPLSDQQVSANIALDIFTSTTYPVGTPVVITLVMVDADGSGLLVIDNAEIYVIEATG